MPSSSHDENGGTYPSGEGGGGSPYVCDPGSELLLAERARVVRGY